MAGVLDAFRIDVPITLRLCEERDLSPLEWLGSLASHRAVMRAQFARHGAGTNVMLVADLGGFPVGQIWIDLERGREDGVAMLWALRVIAPLQRVGIGRRLLAAGERVASQAGFRMAELGAEKTDEALLRFYERAGYRRVGTQISEETFVAADGSPHRYVYDLVTLQKPLER